MSRAEVAASYRLYAAYCFDAARVTLDPGRRLALLNMAQAWTDLADCKQKSGEEDDANAKPLQARLRRMVSRTSRRRD